MTNIYYLKSIKNSTRQDKKKMATFINKNTGKEKIIHFGSKGMSDYTLHKDEDRKNRYLLRHQKNEDWNDFTTAGSLSRWLLWNKPTYKESLTDYKKRFNLN